MQLKFQRSQRAGGILGNTIIFCLDARAEYSPAETANIAKYKLGGQVVYNSQAARRHLENLDRHLDRADGDLMRDKAAGLARGVASLALAKMSLNISIASLGRGHHIECKDLPELLEAEKALIEACRGLKQYLDAAATFNGSVILVDFDDGEKVHLSQGMLELAALPAPSSPDMSAAEPPPGTAPDVVFDVGLWFATLYRDNPKLLPVAGAVLGGIAMLWIFGVGFWSMLLVALLVGGVVVWTRLA